MSKDEIIISTLNHLLKEVHELKENSMFNKAVFNVKDFSIYSGFKESYIYKLTSQEEIEFSKPNGKMVFFDKEKIDQFLLKNPVRAKSSIADEALEYFLRKKF